MQESEASPTRPQARNELQRVSILEAAAALFIKKGFGGTNINDIANALGVSRTAVYYYFQSKESILEALTEEVTQQAGKLAATAAAASAGELPPEEALRELVLRHATLLLTHPVQFRVVERNESNLPEPRRAAARAARHDVLDNFVRVIERGVSAGVFQVPDVQVAAFSIIGMCNWSAWWFEGSGLAVEPTARAMCELAVRAVIRDRGAARQPASVGECLEQIREHLDSLETLHHGAPTRVKGRR